MFTGVTPTRHGIDFNHEEPGIFPAYPTLFEVAHEQGLTTAIVAGKSKLRVLAKPGTIDWEWLQDVDCEEVAAEAERVILTHRPNLTFVHFRDCDYGGHFHTWGSPKQLAALKRIDDGIGRILAAVDRSGMRGSTLVLVTADHGGSGVGHGPDGPGSTIPWIVRGPGVHPNFDLDRIGFLTVHVEDTFATVSLMLGLPITPDIDGKPIRQIVDQTGVELMRDTQ
jgi:arylsulfatase A-like enzyme